MSVKQSSAYCNVCQRQSLFQKPRINHVLHLVLTLVTLGVWGLVWLILGIVNSGKSFRCAQCGTKAGHGAVAPQAAPQQPVRGPVAMPEIPGPEHPERP